MQFCINFINMKRLFFLLASCAFAEQIHMQYPYFAFGATSFPYPTPLAGIGYRLQIKQKPKTRSDSMSQLTAIPSHIIPSFFR